MQRYQKKFRQEWMSSDIKPTGKIRSSIENSNKQYGKQEIKSQLNDAMSWRDYISDQEEYDEEIFYMWYRLIQFVDKLDLL
jgi:hypothetical protein